MNDERARNRGILRAAGVAGLIVAVGVVYWPSLRGMPLADQVVYLIDTLNDRSLFETIAHSYSYTRQRVMIPGDSQAFRPLLFVFLAVEKALFETNFTAWQAMGVALHALVAFQLFRLIRRLRAWAGQGDCFSVPLVLTAFFALNIKAASMVTWAHIHGYILHVVFLLAAFDRLVVFLSVGDARPRRALVLTWVWLFLASFTYELGQVAGLLVALALAAVFFLRGDRRAAFVYGSVFLLVPLIYQAVNWIDKGMHPGLVAETEDATYSAMLARTFSLDTVRNGLRFFSFGILHPFFPASTETFCNSRLCVKEPAWSGLGFGLWTVVSLAALATAGAAGAVGMAGLRKAPRARQTMFVLFLALLIFYCFLQVVGRMNLRPMATILSFNAYYSYIPLLLLALCLGFVWPASRGWTVVLGVLILVTVRSGLGTWEAGGQFADKVARDRDPLDKITGFIREHRHEPGFGIAFDVDALGTKYANGVPWTTIFFRKYENNYKPLYVMTKGPDGQPQWVAGAPRIPSGRSASWAVFPDLVKVGHRIHIYRFQNKYRGMVYLSKKSGFMSEADTMEEAERLARKVLEAELSVGGNGH